MVLIQISDDARDALVIVHALNLSENRAVLHPLLAADLPA
jgi:hypothetical protein